ncbi:hypothetical protein HX109_02420 [Galbibacter sp. BG1]|uniref:hypothetical protein n=1 Tax=Galbibacter sp. BG1 TaxID=1170699 RepID=UPI0015BB98AD|nr:hypothetical protein [Galbibacter sp. BG1]QLE00470.1 hypothetical protein HX109_02420 [Galbibacter sp. BG1]
MSTKKNVFFISCEEAKHICDKVQYGEASLLEKLKLNLRLLWCRATKSYTKRNMKLTELCKEAQIKTLDEQKKSEMKKRLESQES